MRSKTNSSAGPSAWLPQLLCVFLAPACGATEPTADEGGVTTMGSGGTETATATETETETAGESGLPDMADTGGEGVCGDGTLDPGEACDDGNLVEGDGCSVDCQLGPCAWEWSDLSDMSLDPQGGVSLFTPTVVDGDEVLIAHNTGSDAAMATRVLRSSIADGTIGATLDWDFKVGDEAPVAFELDPGGDLFLTNSDRELGLAELRRLSPAGEELWVYSHEAWEGAAEDLGLAANGDLILVSLVQLNAEDRDVLIVGLDPADGSERWVQTYSGPVAANGYSLEMGGVLALDAQGRRFIGVDEYRDWDTISPVVVAYAPGDSGAPLWVGGVELPGKQVDVFAVSVAPEGQVVIAYRIFGGTSPFALSSFDIETGALLWTFERDDLEGDFKGSLIRAVAVNEDRIMALGSFFRDGDIGLRAYALGLAPDGTAVCFTDLTGEDLGQPDWSITAAAMVWTGAEFYVSGFALNPEFTQIQLLRAKVR